MKWWKNVALVYLSVYNMTLCIPFNCQPTNRVSRDWLVRKLTCWVRPMTNLVSSLGNAESALRTRAAFGNSCGILERRRPGLENRSRFSPVATVVVTSRLPFTYSANMRLSETKWQPAMALWVTALLQEKLWSTRDTMVLQRSGREFKISVRSGLIWRRWVIMHLYCYFVHIYTIYMNTWYKAYFLEILFFAFSSH